MRFLLIALMIVLLPLRSWAGDMMTAQMVTTGESQSRIHCAGAAKVLQDNSPSVRAVEEDHCSIGSVCQGVQSVALADGTQMPSLHPIQHRVLMLSGTAFTSATATPGLKPPIS